MLNAETKRHIDAARDVLVGVAPNPMTQVDQITYALIYKFMDDMDQSAIKLGGEPSFFVGDLEPYAYSKLMDSRLGNQERMNLYAEALTKFAEAKQLPELFRTIFRAAFLPYRSPETLGLFLKEINFFDYSHPEELGNAYEYLLSIMSAQGDAGQFRTPRHIIDFMVDVVDPIKTDRVLDPACGTGGFLVSSYNHILEKHDGKDDPTGQEKPLTPDERRKLMENFEGYDIDPSMVRIAQVNMYLHLFKNPKIYQYDSLTNDERWADKFDVILANPPFMTPKGGIRPHAKFSVQSSRSEVLFVDYISTHLRPSGRAAIVVYEPVLFQKSAAHAELRRSLVQQGLVCVVSLPSGVFWPYSGVKTSILFFDKKASTGQDSVLFTKINNDGFELSPSRKPIDGSDLNSVKDEVKLWVSGTRSDSMVGQSVPKADLLSSDGVTLIAERYLGDETGDGDVERTRLGDVLVPISRVKRVGLEEVPVMSITMAQGLIDQSDKFTKRVASADISNYKRVHKNELVVGFPIDEGVLGFQTKYEVAAVSPAYGVWKLKSPETVNVKYLELVLRSNAMRDVYREKMQGSVSRRRTIPEEVFLNIVLPLPPLEQQNLVIEQIDNEERLALEANARRKQILENNSL